MSFPSTAAPLLDIEPIPGILEELEEGSKLSYLVSIVKIRQGLPFSAFSKKLGDNGNPKFFL